MPKIRRRNLPPALLNHLLDRIKRREISSDHLGTLADWLDTEPEVPDGKWFKRFSGMTVCGEGEWSRGDERDIDGNGREAERAGANESIGEDLPYFRTGPNGNRNSLTLAESRSRVFLS
jgi:hypothetical protein